MLSILIPSYNHSKYIEEAILSALSIEIKEKKIYIIDDGSKDGSVEIIEEFLEKNKENNVIEFVKKNENKGVIDSVNIFLKKINTEYIYFMASDDVVKKDGIKQLVNELERNKELAFVIGGGENKLKNGKNTQIYSKKHEIFFNLKKEELLKNLYIDYPSPILCQSTVFRSNAIKAVGGFVEAEIADDYAIFTRLIAKYNQKNINFKFLPEVKCVEYRHHDENSYKNILRQVVATRQILINCAPKYLLNQATGNKIANYALVSAKNREWKTLSEILKILTIKEYGWFILAVIKKICEYIRKK